MMNKSLKRLKNETSVLIIGYIILIFSVLLTSKFGVAQPSEYQFKITYVGIQEKVVKSIGLTSGFFDVNVFTPYRTYGIHYSNDEIAVITFSINADETSRIVTASQPHMITESYPYISFMIWDGSTVEEALLSRTSAITLLDDIINALDPSNTRGILMIRGIRRILDPIPPSITILSPQNITYYKTYIPLNFAIDEPILWVNYSLDNKPSITITNNTTLTGLSNEPHNIILYASDISGNTGSSDKVYFSVCIGDVNGDGKIDIRDIAFIAKLFGSVCGDGRYNTKADMNDDCKIDIRDIALAAKYFGKTC